jgi:hypothetical protein
MLRLSLLLHKKYPLDNLPGDASQDRSIGSFQQLRVCQSNVEEGFASFPLPLNLTPASKSIKYNASQRSSIGTYLIGSAMDRLDSPVLYKKLLLILQFWYEGRSRFEGLLTPACSNFE